MHNFNFEEYNHLETFEERKTYVFARQEKICPQIIDELQWDYEKYTSYYNSELGE